MRGESPRPELTTTRVFRPRTPLARIRARIDAWARRRQGFDPQHLTLANRRIYVLPTGPGLLFAVLVVTLWLGAMNYNNNLGFALAFLLAALGITGIHHCHRNLLDLEIHLLGAPPVHAGEMSSVQFLIGSNAKADRPALRLEWESLDGQTTSVRGNSQRMVTLPLPTTRRGWHALPRLQVSTRFPLGLVRAWSWVFFDARFLVYPRPASLVPESVAANAMNVSGRDEKRGEDDFGGLRPFRTGDPPQRIAWKIFARTADLVVTELRGGGTPEELRIDWNDYPGYDTEARVAVLARRVLDAHQGRSRWSLRTPAEEFGTDSGHRHLHNCLAHLATCGLPGTTTEPA